uniref:Retrotransposon Copia-like N-terminal domain-containing protein n=1 Tax=Cannabis sativa TaxID=3483 RepID=A0A803Q9C5_CANSA
MLMGLYLKQLVLLALVLLQETLTPGQVLSEIFKASGIKEALSWIKSKNWQDVTLETDCMVAIQDIKKTLTTASMGRTSTLSQEGVPPSTTEHNQSESNPDAFSAPVVNTSVAPRQIHNSRSRSQIDNDILELAHSSSDPLVGDLPQPSIPIRHPSTLNHLAHQDVSSPFFLTTADHPSLILVSTILNGANYQYWKQGIIIALTSKNKSTFVDGTFLDQQLVILFSILGFVVTTW